MSITTYGPYERSYYPSTTSSKPFVYNNNYLWIESKGSYSYKSVHIWFNIISTTDVSSFKVESKCEFKSQINETYDRGLNTSNIGNTQMWVEEYNSSGGGTAYSNYIYPSSGKFDSTLTLTEPLKKFSLHIYLETTSSYTGTRLGISFDSNILIPSAPSTSTLSISGYSIYTDKYGTTYKYVDTSKSYTLTSTVTSTGYPEPTNTIYWYQNDTTYNCGSSLTGVVLTDCYWANTQYFYNKAKNDYGEKDSSNFYLYTGESPYISHIDNVELGPSDTTKTISIRADVYGISVTGTASSNNTNVVTVGSITPSVGSTTFDLVLTRGTTIGTAATVTVKLTDTVYGESSRTFAVTNTDTPTVSISVDKNTIDIGDDITFTASVTTYSTGTYTYLWKVDSYAAPDVGGSGSGYTVISKSNTSLKLHFFESGTYTISLTVTPPSEYSTTAETNITVLRDTDNQITRYKVVLFDNTQECLVITRNFKGPLYYDLNFEKRLDETGQGNMRVFIPNGYSTNLLQQNTQLVIFDEMIPIYCGVITEVNQVSNSMYGVSTQCLLYDVEFEDVIRNLSQDICQTESVYGYSSPSIIVKNGILGGRDYAGDVDNISTYSFTTSSQSRLSLLESFSNQTGQRYRTSPNVCTWSYTSGESTITAIGVNADCIWSPYDITIGYNQLWYGVKCGDLVFGYSEDPSDSWLFAGIVYYKSSDASQRVVFSSNKIYKINMDVSRGTTQSYIQMTFMHALAPRTSNGTIGTFEYYCDYLVDFKTTYYQDDSVFTFKVNENTYDVDGSEQIYNHYGVVSCYSPHSSGYNVTCTIPLNNVIGPNNEVVDLRYITYSHDSYVYDVYTDDSGYYIVEIYDNGIPTSGWTTSTPKVKIRVKDYTTKLQSWYSYEPNVSYGSVLRYDEETNTSFYVAKFKLWLATGNPIIEKGAYVSYPIYTLNKSLPSGTTSIYIGGTYLTNTSSTTNSYYIASSNVLSVVYNNEDLHYVNTVYKSGTIVQYGTAQPDSPHKLYGEQSYSCQLENGMTYDEVAYMASKIARYGSNQTSNITGTINLQLFQKPQADIGGHVPLSVGDHVDFDKGTNGEDDDYELIAYTVHADKMAVDYEAGMKTKNIGDVVYTINSNMSTNIN